nr:hypothetical protein [Acinetobacter baumannii]
MNKNSYRIIYSKARQMWNKMRFLA